MTIYFSDFKRSLVDKLQKDFFSEPSQVGATQGVTRLGAPCSIACESCRKPPCPLDRWN